MADLIVKKTENDKGIFSNKKFKKGDKIFEFNGSFFTFDQLPTPYNEVEDHYVQIEKDLYMGPSGKEDDFFNHSCNPNSGLKINGKKVFLIAIKNIKKGEEITWDYSTTMDEDEFEMICNCGSKKCRKIIRDFKHLPKYLKQKYIKLGIVPEYNLKYVK